MSLKIMRCWQSAVIRLMHGCVIFVQTALLLTMMPDVSAARHEADTLRTQLKKFLAIASQQTDLKALQRFYSSRNYQPVWLQSNSLSALHEIALQFIANAETEGLDSKDYQLNELRRMRMDDWADNPYALEFRTTQALLRLAEDLRRGQYSAHEIDPDWHIPQPPFDSVVFLLQAVSSGQFQQWLNDLPPKIPSYQLLKQALAKYRDLVANQTVWTQIPAGVVWPGVSHPIISFVRDRINEAYKIHGIAEYNLPSTSSDYYDADLVNAIRTFQGQHGLNPDGIIGKNTRRALNKTPAEKVRQIRLNLERLRWLPRQLGERYVLVNTAGFQLAAVKHDQQILNMRIIVGLNYRATPSFSSHIIHMVLNPYWNIPASIARKDLLPKQQKDPDFFTSQGIKVYRGYDYSAAPIDPQSVDWLAIKEGFPYVLRQDPGAKNALGTIKFMLPNPFSIYLHDTPAKSLFDREIRTFSSGCIRLEQPLKLAAFAMEEHSTQAELAEQINTGKTIVIKLPQPLPVYIVYLTSWVDGQHHIHFSPDSYGRDKRALSLIAW